MQPNILQETQLLCSAEAVEHTAVVGNLVEGTLVEDILEEGTLVEGNLVEGTLVEDKHLLVDTLVGVEHQQEVVVDDRSSS